MLLRALPLHHTFCFKSSLGSRVLFVGFDLGMGLNFRQLHVRLLSDIDYDVEKAMGGLKTETKHAMETRKKTGNCHLYVCIVVLLIVLVLLLVLSS